MKSLLKRLFGKTEVAATAVETAVETSVADRLRRISVNSPFVPMKPFEIRPFANGVIIQGPPAPSDCDDHNSITVGETLAPDMNDETSDLVVQNCIVTDYDGMGLERKDADARELLHALADMLGYTLTKK